ncbi:MAG: hypothetical protein WBA74_09040 [Cyclobacteriaceae bacterium]
MKTTILLILAITLQTTAFAQEEEITEEDIVAYASLMLKVDSMKTAAKEQFSEMVKNHELMAGGKRYNELKKAIGDEEKLAEINATEEEIAAYNELVAFNTQASVDIKTVFSSSVKEGLGARKYNAIKKKLKTDADFKTKYQEIYDNMAGEMEESTEEEAN